MSTNIPSKWIADTHRTQVNILVTENAFFGALSNLVEYRRAVEGLTKVSLAERLGKDKGTVTKLTASPTNMKISTIATMADALGAQAVLLFVANENSSLIFTSVGVRDCGTAQVKFVDAPRSNRFAKSNVWARNWIEQPRELVDA